MSIFIKWQGNTGALPLSRLPLSSATSSEDIRSKPRGMSPLHREEKFAYRYQVPPEIFREKIAGAKDFACFPGRLYGPKGGREIGKNALQPLREEDVVSQLQDINSASSHCRRVVWRFAIKILAGERIGIEQQPELLADLKEEV